MFRNPVGFFPAEKNMFTAKGHGAGFIVTTPPKDNVISWVSSLKQKYSGEVVMVDLKEDISRNFSLSYDFADIITVDPDGNEGIESPDIADTVTLLDSLLNLRLCYEKYTPVFFRISSGVTPDECEKLLSFCLLSGIDGIVVPGVAKLSLVMQLSSGRIPVIGSAQTEEEALEMLDKGASLIELRARPLTLKKLIKSLSNK